VLLTGGVRTPSDALVGPMAIAALRSLHLDTVFMGVHGMAADAGFSTPNLLEAETNRAMIASGRRLVVLADSTKWGVVGLSSMAALSMASALISDTGLSQTARQALGEQVDELVLVAPEHTSEDWDDSPRATPTAHVSPGPSLPRAT
jgi:DeoR/GlpR family transcriptional regulator of sugar metabolism